MPDPAFTTGVGERVDGRYELIEILGSGKFGIVWRVYDHHRGQASALKLMRGTADTEAWKEATLLTRLESDHILHVRNADVSVDAPYIETALAEKGTAQATLGAHGIDPGRAVHFTRGMLQGLELCHQRRLLHRDIKPSNVFLTANDDAQIGDFGVAAVMDANGQAAPHGDPDIRAPELFSGGVATVVSDVYSAGLTLRAMLTGDLPYDFWADEDVVRHAADVIAGPVDIRDVAPHVSRTLARVIRTAAHKNPNQRYTSAAEFDTALANLSPVKITVKRVSGHSGHEGCWEVVRIRDRQKITVCHAITAIHTIEVRRQPTGTRLRSLCFEAKTPAQARVKLREVFDQLR